MAENDDHRMVNGESGLLQTATGVRLSDGEHPDSSPLLHLQQMQEYNLDFSSPNVHCQHYDRSSPPVCHRQNSCTPNDSGTESSEDPQRIINHHQVVANVQDALTKLATTLRSGHQFFPHVMSSERRMTILQLVAKLQASLPASTSKYPHQNGSSMRRASQPTLTMHRSHHNKNSLNRHTIAVTREELIHARRLMQEVHLGPIKDRIQYSDFNPFSIKRQKVFRSDTIKMSASRSMATGDTMVPQQLESQKYNENFNVPTTTTSVGQVALNNTKDAAPLPLPSFEPRTDNDKKFHAFINSSKDVSVEQSNVTPNTHVMWNKGGTNWSNKFDRIKTKFEVAATPTNNNSTNMSSSKQNTVQTFRKKFDGEYKQTHQKQSGLTTKFPLDRMPANSPSRTYCVNNIVKNFSHGSGSPFHVVVGSQVNGSAVNSKQISQRSNSMDNNMQRRGFNGKTVPEENYRKQHKSSSKHLEYSGSNEVATVPERSRRTSRLDDYERHTKKESNSEERRKVMIQNKRKSVPSATHSRPMYYHDSPDENTHNLCGDLLSTYYRSASPKYCSPQNDLMLWNGEAQNYAHNIMHHHWPQDDQYVDFYKTNDCDELRSVRKSECYPLTDCNEQLLDEQISWSSNVSPLPDFQAENLSKHIESSEVHLSPPQHLYLNNSNPISVGSCSKYYLSPNEEDDHPYDEPYKAVKSKVMPVPLSQQATTVAQKMPMSRYAHELADTLLSAKKSQIPLRSTITTNNTFQPSVVPMMSQFHNVPKPVTRPYAPPLMANVPKSKSSHNLNMSFLPVTNRQYEARRMSSDEKRLKQETIEHFLLPTDKPQQRRHNNTSINRTKTSDKSCYNQGNRIRNTAEQTHTVLQPLIRSRTLPDVVCAEMLDESNVDESFEYLFRSNVKHQ